jgi:hypothetical protein
MKPAFSASRSLLQLHIDQTDVATDGLGPPARMRAVHAEGMKLIDERRCALETVLGDHRPLVPQWHAGAGDAVCSATGWW